MANRHEILVSLASKCNTVPYDVLMSALNLTNEREFEDFIIQAIYQDVIQARLNPVKRHLEIHDWNSEKLGEPDLQFMATTLKHWDRHSGNFLNAIGTEMDRSNALVAEIAANEKSVGEEAESIRQSFAFDEGKKFILEKDGLKAPSKPETKRFKSGINKNKRGGN